MIVKRIKEILQEQIVLETELEAIKNGLVGKKVKFTSRKYLGNDQWRETTDEGIVVAIDDGDICIQGDVMCYRKIESIIKVEE